MSAPVGRRAVVSLLLATILPPMVAACGSSHSRSFRADCLAPRPLSPEERERLVPLPGRVHARDVDHVILLIPLRLTGAAEVEELVARAVASRGGDGAVALLDVVVEYDEFAAGPLALLYASCTLEVSGRPAVLRPKEVEE